MNVTNKSLMRVRIEEVVTTNMKEARSLKKLTQKELALKAGICRESVARFESGARKPSPNVARRIARVLDLTLEQMWSMFYATDDQETA
jgi:DNA-binding XRE family transcriptional regulator